MQRLESQSLIPSTKVSFEVVTVDAQGKILEKCQRSTEYYQELLAPNVTLDLVTIPQGVFTMGSPKDEIGQHWYQVWDQSLVGVSTERPQHQVNVPAFLIGKFPVTQAQWQIVAAMPEVDKDLAQNPADFKGDRRPIEQVSWDDAIEFCKRLSRYTGRNYRLPSEAEWEYACRAGTTTPYYFGETIAPDLANYCPLAGEHNGCQWSGAYGKGPTGDYRQQTTDVGNFPPNAFGVYEMHGNVWEWCLDRWHQTYHGAPTDGSAWLSSNPEDPRVLRGGAWFYFPDLSRSAYRNRRPRDTRLNRIGFRVACDIA